MEGNVFSQLQDWRKRRAEKASPAEINRIATMRNDKTHADEAAWIVRVLLWLTAIFCAWASYFYYKDNLSASFSPRFVAFFSVALPLIVEILKVKIAHNVIRSIFFGWAFKTGWTLGYWAFLGILAAGAFWWSITISTDGMEKYSAMKADKGMETDSLATYIAAATVGIDQQIAAVQANYEQAMATKWKGTTTYQAQKSAQSSSKTIEALQSQRSGIVAQATRDYQERKQKRSGRIDLISTFVERFGGYMELGCFLSIISLVFFERRLFDLYREAIKKLDPDPGGGRMRPEASTLFSKNGQSPAGPASPPAPQNRFPFDLSDRGNIWHLLNAVPRSPQTVARQNPEYISTDADAVLRLAKKGLQSRVANFNSREHLPRTTAIKIWEIINDVGQKMEGRGFEPSPDVAADFFAYITETVFPVLRDNRFPYEYENAFLSALERFVPKAA